MKDKIFQISPGEWMAVANGISLQKSFPDYKQAWTAVETEKKRQIYRSLVPYSETLFVHTNWTCSIFYLRDSKNFHITAFKSLEDCRIWCEDNDYRLSEIYLKKQTFK